jgi:hypothetical protein
VSETNVELQNVNAATMLHSGFTRHEREIQSRREGKKGEHVGKHRSSIDFRAGVHSIEKRFEFLLNVCAMNCNVG